MPKQTHHFVWTVRNKVILRRCRVVMLALCFLPLVHRPQDAFAAPIERLQLQVGETRTVDLVAEGNLHVSHRGIVEVVHMNGKKWHLTALREGFAVIRSAGDEGASLYITVEKSSEGSTPKSALKRACDISEARCEPETGIVRGRFSSWLTFHATRKLCEGSTACLFAARLKQKTAQQIQAKLGDRLGRAFSVSLTDSGQARVTTFCANRPVAAIRKQVLARASRLLAPADPLVQCLDAMEPRLYRAKARILSIETDRSDRSGLDTSLTGLFEGFPFSSDAALEAQIESLARTEKARILGRPEWMTRSGRKTHFATGGEFRVRARVGDSEKNRVDIWKRHGLEMSFTISPAGMDRVSLVYDVTLKRRGSGKTRSLSLHAAKGDTLLPLGRPTKLAAVDLSSKNLRTESPSVFEQVPILGPLFRLMTKVKGHIKLVVWLTVEPRPL